MANALGVLGILVFIVAVISLAAAVTWIVVKLSPPKASSGGGLFARLAAGQTRDSGKSSSSGT
jgi:hypothetical protein